jgi:hypothetical protein
MVGFRVGVFALLFDERDRVLLCLREDLKVWTLLGGALAGTREAMETGYFALDEIRDRTVRRHEVRVRGALSHSGEAVMKTQLGTLWRGESRRDREPRR